MWWTFRWTTGAYIKKTETCILLQTFAICVVHLTTQHHNSQKSFQKYSQTPNHSQQTPSQPPERLRPRKDFRSPHSMQKKCVCICVHVKNSDGQANHHCVHVWQRGRLKKHGQPYPLVPSLPAGVVLLGEVPQVVVVVEVEELHQVLQGRPCPLVNIYSRDRSLGFCSSGMEEANRKKKPSQGTPLH